MLSQTISVDVMPQEMNRLAASLTNPRNLNPVLKSASLMMVSSAKDCLNRGQTPDGIPFPPLAHTRPAGGNKPLRDKGLLAASISGRNSDTEAAAATNLEYAALQNYGGTVTAKKSKFLAIPLTLEAARAGSPRNFPRRLVAIVQSAQNRGVLIDNELEPQYVLVKSVTIPARPFMGFGPKLLDRLTLLFQEYFTNLVKGR